MEILKQTAHNRLLQESDFGALYVSYMLCAFCHYWN